MITALVLICAAGMAPAACTIETAESVIQGPQASRMAQCSMLGQAYVADTALAGGLAEGRYLKVVCRMGGGEAP